MCPRSARRALAGMAAREAGARQAGSGKILKWLPEMAFQSVYIAKFPGSMPPEPSSDSRLLHTRTVSVFCSQTSLFRTGLIRDPRYFEVKLIPLRRHLAANSVISKPRYFDLFFMSRGTWK